MTWPAAAARALSIFVYFVVATVWLPSRVLRIGFIADANSFVEDLVVLIVWGAALSGGMYALRVAQRRKII